MSINKISNQTTVIIKKSIKKYLNKAEQTALKNSVPSLKDLDPDFIVKVDIGTRFGNHPFIKVREKGFKGYLKTILGFKLDYDRQKIGKQFSIENIVETAKAAIKKYKENYSIKNNIKFMLEGSTDNDYPTIQTTPRFHWSKKKYSKY